MAAMSGLMMSTTTSRPLSAINYTPPAPPKKKLSPEEEAEQTAAEIEKRTQKFLLDLKEYNEKRAIQFPAWKTYEVFGFNVVASNLKNAHKKIKALLHGNHITIKE